jgi:hypothetical protein
MVVKLPERGSSGAVALWTWRILALGDAMRSIYDGSAWFSSKDRAWLAERHLLPVGGDHDKTA